MANKHHALDDLELFELLQAAYPEKFPDDSDASWDAVQDFAHNICGYDDLAELLGRVERPILMSAPMVRAILAGMKTQTRRAIRKQFSTEAEPAEVSATSPEGWQILGHSGLWWDDSGACIDDAIRCPYGRPGDRLWVRETWQHSNFPLGPYDESCTVFYRADYLDDPHGPDGEKSNEGKYRKWVPSIHMFRSASRILLEITAVRVERLQDISEADAISEGCYKSPRFPQSGLWTADDRSFTGSGPIGCYRWLWESINGPGSWDANPWVWVIEFRSVTP